MESYKHIELTEEEMNEAIIWGKQRKENRIQQAELRMREDQNRRLLIDTRFSYKQTRSLMEYRADQLFEGKFIVDQNNEAVFEMLCYYFSEDSQFEILAALSGVVNPSINKGILLAGNFGVGKTWLMRIMQKNQRQVYYMRHAKEIANDFAARGEKQKDQEDSLENKFKNPINDASLFFHKYSGLCIDDLGTEDIKSHYGNKKNVVGDLIESRYTKGNTGVYLHGTTNLNAGELRGFYGERVTSRMREIFNFIELGGQDRRK